MEKQLTADDYVTAAQVSENMFTFLLLQTTSSSFYLGAELAFGLHSGSQLVDAQL